MIKGERVSVAVLEYGLLSSAPYVYTQVERFFARLKDEFGGRMIFVRGNRNVMAPDVRGVGDPGRPASRERLVATAFPGRRSLSPLFETKRPRKMRPDTGLILDYGSFYNP